MDLNVLIVCLGLFVGLPWVVMHYVTQWKTAATITNDDEALLDELYQLSRRLDARMDTIERLVASDNPEFSPLRIVETQEEDRETLDAIDRTIRKKKERR